MKKYLTLLVLCASSSFAMTDVDFSSDFYKDPTHFTCNGKKISPQSTINNLLMNCKNAKVIEHDEPTPNQNAQMHNANAGSSMDYNEVDGSSQFTVDVVKFLDDKNSSMTCKFLNNQLKKCKYKPVKSTNVPSSAPLTNVKTTASAPVN
ncbi:MAG: hypothetical protein EKK54_09390 [Neisseriaceae bacterium]|nr:MAG: hypothetical protein EKK54_09390 [Neisseriaceae bacterium]